MCDENALAPTRYCYSNAIIQDLSIRMVQDDTELRILMLPPPHFSLKELLKIHQKTFKNLLSKLTFYIGNLHQLN